MQRELTHLIQSIPVGRVVSYGSLAVALYDRFSIETSGWLVARSLSHMPKDVYLPWRRVVNKQGKISSLVLGDLGLRQIQHLEQE